MRWLVVSFCLLTVGCSQPAPELKTEVKSAAEVKRYELQGEIKELDTENKIAKIQHEKIGDWMEAMTMEFPVKDPADFAKLRTGQKIKATVFVQDLHFWVGEVQEDPK
jgi:Cu/Ag efflux protein CusF